MRPAPRSKATPTAMRGVMLAVQCCWYIRNPCSCLCALVHEPPELFRFKGHFQMRYPKGSQGITNALGPQGIKQRRRDGASSCLHAQVRPGLTTTLRASLALLLPSLPVTHKSTLLVGHANPN